MKWFLAFSPKASKSLVLQAGLLTHSNLNSLPKAPLNLPQGEKLRISFV